MSDEIDDNNDSDEHDEDDDGDGLHQESRKVAYCYARGGNFGGQGQFLGWCCW